MKKSTSSYVKGSGGKGNAPKADQVHGTSLKKFVQNLAFHGEFGPDDPELRHIVKTVYGVTFVKKGESTKTVKKESSLKMWIGKVTRSADEIKNGVKKEASFLRDDGRPRIVGQDSHTTLPSALDKMIDEAQDKYRGKKPVAAK